MFLFKADRGPWKQDADLHPAVRQAAVRRRPPCGRLRRPWATHLPDLSLRQLLRYVNTNGVVAVVALNPL